MQSTNLQKDKLALIEKIIHTEDLKHSVAMKRQSDECETL